MSHLIVGTSGSGQPTAGYGAKKVSEVARIVGGEDENSVRAQALDCINRIIEQLNMYDLRSMKRSVTATSFVSGQRHYSLPSAFKSASFFRVLYASDSRPYCDLKYRDDESLTHEFPTQTHTGVPVFYSLRNTFNDGYISFYPVPDSSTVSAYKYSGEYYTRLGKLTDDQTTITDMQPEVDTVLVTGAQSMLLREHKKDSVLAPQLQQDYMRLLRDLIVFDRRVSDEKTRFRLGTHGNYAVTADDYYGRF